MSALASAQENVLLETWGQKLDLTIQSSEMPSTWVLDSKDKQEIMMGLTCCYRKELIDYVHQEHSKKLIRLKLKEKRNELQYTLHYRPEDYQIIYFTALQLLDIYSTHHAIKYDCVKESNPFLPKRPTIVEMVALKTAILAPTRSYWTFNDFREVNGITTLVVLQNFSLLDKAKNRCNRY